MSYDVSWAMNATVGALRNMFLNDGSWAICGFFFLNTSVSPSMNSGLSTTRTSHDCLFCPLGAWMPQFRIVCIVSRPTAWGLYWRMLRRVIMFSITTSDFDGVSWAVCPDCCAAGVQLPTAAHRHRPPTRVFTVFIFSCLLSKFCFCGGQSFESSVSSSSVRPSSAPSRAAPACSKVLSASCMNLPACSLKAAVAYSAWYLAISFTSSGERSL